MRKWSPALSGAEHGIAQLIYELTDFGEARCLRIAQGIIALGNTEKEDEDHE